MVECLLLSILGPQLGMHGSWLVHASDPPPHVILVGLSGCPNHLRTGNFRAEGAHLSHVAQYIQPNSTQGEPLSSYQLPWRARYIPSGTYQERIPGFNSSAPAGVPLPGGELNPSSLSRPAFSELGLPRILIFSSALHSAVLLIQPTS